MRESKEGGSRKNMAGVLNEMLSKAELLSLLRLGVRKEIILSWVDRNEREGVLAICRHDEILGQSQLKGKRVSSTVSSTVLDHRAVWLGSSEYRSWRELVKSRR